MADILRPLLIHQAIRLLGGAWALAGAEGFDLLEFRFLRFHVRQVKQSRPQECSIHYVCETCVLSFVGEETSGRTGAT